MSIGRALSDLDSQRKALAANLVAKGVTASDTETLAQLVPKIMTIEGGGGASSSGLKFKLAGRETEIASGTVINYSLPTLIAPGDLLVFAGYNRSDMTIPAGWTEAASYQFTYSALQINRIFYKIAAASDAGSAVALTQSASGRMAFSLIVIQNPLSSPITFRASSTDSSAKASVPNDVVNYPGEITVLVCSNYISTTITTEIVRQYISGPAIADLSQPQVLVPRLCYGVAEYEGVITGELISSYSLVGESAITAVTFTPA